MYSAESRMRHPLLLFREMIQDLIGSRELAWRLVVRDISALYRQTALGYFWAVFPPLVTSGVFILLNSSKVIDGKGIAIPYPVYVMAGTVFWQLFVDALNAPLKAVSEAKAVLTKINLPKEAFILAGIGQVMFGFCIKMILLAIACLLFKASIAWSALLLPVPLLALLLLGTMIGVFLVPIGLLYKDIHSALLIVTSGLVFVTPVAFPPGVGGTIGKLIGMNPLSPLLVAARNVMFEGIPADLQPFATVFFVTVALLLVGWIVYRLAIPIIVERIGA
jgi:lipopolysaccharide transport system permease protein